MKRRLKRTFSAVSYDIFMKIHEKKAETNVFGRLYDIFMKKIMKRKSKRTFSDVSYDTR